MKIRTTLEPNQESDIQTFEFEDLGITKEEFDSMSDGEKKELLQECVVDNIYGMVTSFTITE